MLLCLKHWLKEAAIYAVFVQSILRDDTNSRLDPLKMVTWQIQYHRCQSPLLSNPKSPCPPSQKDHNPTRSSFLYVNLDTWSSWIKVPWLLKRESRASTIGILGLSMVATQTEGDLLIFYSINRQIEIYTSCEPHHQSTTKVIGMYLLSRIMIQACRV